MHSKSDKFLSSEGKKTGVKLDINDLLFRPAVRRIRQGPEVRKFPSGMPMAKKQ